MEIKTFHGFEDFCVEKFENTDEWYYGIYPTWMSNVEVAEECGKEESMMEVSYSFLIKLAGHMSR